MGAGCRVDKQVIAVTKGHNYQMPNYSTELHKRSFIPHSLFQYYWLQLHCHFFHLSCILCYVNPMSSLKFMHVRLLRVH